MSNIKQLQEIWNEIPNIDCCGKCEHSCDKLSCSSLEKDIIENKSNKTLCANGPATCSMLKDGRCTVYSIRPTICRLWGVTEKLRCPYGCKVERILTQDEAMDIMARTIHFNK